MEVRRPDKVPAKSSSRALTRSWEEHTLRVDKPSFHPAGCSLKGHQGIRDKGTPSRGCVPFFVSAMAS